MANQQSTHPRKPQEPVLHGDRIEQNQVAHRYAHAFVEQNPFEAFPAGGSGASRFVEHTIEKVSRVTGQLVKIVVVL